ncbi:hypothetical protein MMC12_005371 [Toensbergia leucococca]|nr:hypothetical protein [Toensbergia leucococca]
MAFPFLRLPGNVRNIVYKYLFLSTHQDHAIKPDPLRILRRSNITNICYLRWSCRWHLNLHASVIRASDRISFLRVSKQIYDEAGAIFYGENQFLFEDRSYSYGPCDENVQENDFTTMYLWLLMIGTKNRATIRHIRLNFSTALFCYYPEEVLELYPEGIEGQSYDDPMIAPSNSGAKYLADALELLSHEHNLREVMLSFHELIQDQERTLWGGHNPLFDLFRGPVEEIKLLQAFRKIKGVKRLNILLDPFVNEQCDEFTQKAQDAREIFWKLCDEMEEDAEGKEVSIVDFKRTAYEESEIRKELRKWMVRQQEWLLGKIGRIQMIDDFDRSDEDDDRYRICRVHLSEVEDYIPLFDGGCEFNLAESREILSRIRPELHLEADEESGPTGMP